MIKCHKINENSIKPNDKFKPIKVHAKKELLDDQQKIMKLEESLQEIACLKVYEDLESISKKPNHSKVDTLTVKVTTISRPIHTSKGVYQICNIKDINGNTGSMNLYSQYVNSL